MGVVMLRLLGQPEQSGVGLRGRMSKVDTDEGLGPGSEDRRREVRKAQEELDSHSKLKGAQPVDKNAVTEPGLGKVEKRSDTVDSLLDGFGPARQDLPRILPNKNDTTPPPEPVRKELTPTEPGRRQKLRNRVIAGVLAFGVVVGAGVVIVRMGAHQDAATPAPSATDTAHPANTAVATPTATATETVPTITTMSVEALPTVKTSAPAHSTHATHASSSHATSAPTATTTAATTAAPRPTGSAPPGLNLLPDDPHR